MSIRQKVDAHTASVGEGGHISGRNGKNSKRPLSKCIPLIFDWLFFNALTFSAMIMHYDILPKVNLPNDNGALDGGVHAFSAFTSRWGYHKWAKGAYTKV
jgi:hypothetical protein